MRIAFLLGSPDISGGTNIIFEHGTRLQGLGHQVTMVTDEVIDAARYSWHPAASELTWRTFGELDQHMFDLAIATWWQSVYQLHRVCSREYLYFVQSIESRFFPSQNDSKYSLWDINILRDWCENTYSGSSLLKIETIAN